MLVDLRHVHNFVNGNKVPAVADEWIDNISPVTNTVIGQIPRSRATDVDQAVQAAYYAHRQRQWSAVPIEQRAELMLKVASVLESRLETFAVMESCDTGKPLNLTRTVDIPRAIANLRFFARLALTSSTEAVMNETQKALHYSVRKPVGVVAMVTPWNLPLYLLTWKLAPALVMGNTVVAKVSPQTLNRQ